MKHNAWIAIKWGWLTYLTLLLFLLGKQPELSAQTIQLKYTDYPLNEVLLDLNDRYGLAFSIDAQKAALCSISIDQSFQNMDRALEALTKQCPIQFKKLNKVYAFYFIEILKDRAINQSYLFQGMLVEATSLEPLPFGHLKVGDRIYLTDKNGQFSFTSQNKRIGLHASSLGYQTIDTLLTANRQLRLVLVPIPFMMNEVTVLEEKAPQDIGVGPEVAEYRFNDVQQKLVPGLNANAVFNHMRMIPGVMASGESVSDYVIWGSYAGQNHTVYDGITLFANQGINRDIGRLNPFMVKNIQILNGGYNVDKGDRTAGYIAIEGKQGSVQRFETQAGLTNDLALAYVNLPIRSLKSSLQIAGRLTYNDAIEMQPSRQRNADFLQPSYQFGDANLKWSSLLSKNTQMSLSWVSSNDQYALEQNISSITSNSAFQLVRGRSDLLRLESSQKGASFSIKHLLENGAKSELLMSWSEYIPKQFNSSIFQINREPISPLPIGRDVEQINIRTDSIAESWQNPVEEFSAQLTYELAESQQNSLKFISGLYHHQASSTLSEIMAQLTAPTSQLTRAYASGLLTTHFSSKLSMTTGLRSDWAFQLQKLYLQPRFSLGYTPTTNWNFNLGAGIYRQFIGLNTVIDEIGNSSSIWQTATLDKVPVLNVQQVVGGLGWHKNKWNARLTAYYKSINDFNRYIAEERRQQNILLGESEVKGLDVWLSRQTKEWQVSVAYTLSEVLERYSERLPFRSAPQDQLHELKWMNQFRWEAVQFSISQVWSSGLQTIVRNNTSFEVQRNPYARTDFAIEYSKVFSQNALKFGFSAINLFDQQNVRLNGAQNIPDGRVLNTLGLGRTLNIYLKWQFLQRI